MVNEIGETVNLILKEVTGLEQEKRRYCVSCNLPAPYSLEYHKTEDPHQIREVIKCGYCGDQLEAIIPRRKTVHTF